MLIGNRKKILQVLVKIANSLFMHICKYLFRRFKNHNFFVNVGYSNIRPGSQENFERKN